MIFFTILNPSSRPVFFEDFLAIYKAWNEVSEKTTFLTITCGGNFLNKKKRSIRALDKKKKQRKKLLLGACHWKKSFFLKHTWFCWSLFEHHFQRFFFNGSFRTVLSGGSKLAGAKKKITSKTVKSQSIFQYVFFFIGLL